MPAVAGVIKPKRRVRWTKSTAIHFLVHVGMTRHAKALGKFHSKRGTDQGWEGYARRLRLG